MGASFKERLNARLGISKEPVKDSERVGRAQRNFLEAIKRESSFVLTHKTTRDLSTVPLEKGGGRKNMSITFLESGLIVVRTPEREYPFAVMFRGDINYSWAASFTRIKKNECGLRVHPIGDKKDNLAKDFYTIYVDTGQYDWYFGRNNNKEEDEDDDDFL